MTGMPYANTLDALLAEAARGRKPQVDSRLVRPGDIFVALPPHRGGRDGLEFLPQALERGAAYVLVASDARLPDQVPALVIRHDDPRQALGLLAAAHHGTARLPFPLLAVTGTNGKTSICAMLEHLFASAGRKVGVLGTVSTRWPGVERSAALTTPGCLELHGVMAEMAAAGVDVATMEVSSHALDQQRVAGLEFAGAILTNITQDHLDYHTDMEDYARAKFRLFFQCPRQDKPAAVNADDPYGARLLSMLDHAVGFGLHPLPPLDQLPDHRLLRGRILEHGIQGMTLGCRFRGAFWTIASPLVGLHNASNLLAAQALALQTGLDVGDMASLETFHGVSGRLERVRNAKGLHVFVDYAHTPDALENVLKSLDLLRRGRLITVFGCGGDRDRAKRPLMGRAVCRFSDVAVLTSDNPRTEDPLAIINDVLPGTAGCKELLVEPDRRQAIRQALDLMDDTDICVIAGKGHEDYQIIGTVKHPFSDQAEVRAHLGPVLAGGVA